MLGKMTGNPIIGTVKQNISGDPPGAALAGVLAGIQAKLESFFNRGAEHTALTVDNETKEYTPMTASEASAKGLLDVKILSDLSIAVSPVADNVQTELAVAVEDPSGKNKVEWMYRGSLDPSDKSNYQQLSVENDFALAYGRIYNDGRFEYGGDIKLMKGSYPMVSIPERFGDRIRIGIEVKHGVMTARAIIEIHPKAIYEGYIRLAPLLKEISNGYRSGLIGPASNDRSNDLMKLRQWGF